MIRPFSLCCLPHAQKTSQPPSSFCGPSDLSLSTSQLKLFQVTNSLSLDNLSGLLRTSESFGDLNAELSGGAAGGAGKAGGKGPAGSARQQPDGEGNKPFGLGMWSSFQNFQLRHLQKYLACGNKLPMDINSATWSCVFAHIWQI